MFGIFCLFVRVRVGSVSLAAFNDGEGRFWWSRARSNSSFAGSEWGVEVDKEGFDIVWEVNWGEKEVR